MSVVSPKVSVIMATWGRGRHILPSIRSVLAQDMPDFELIVAGDACQDETEATVAAVGDPRLRWINLDRRVGSQSGPNNAGIRAARAGIIAYIGHDDIWEPDHLTAILAGFADPMAPDFVISGLISHLPPGVPRHDIDGIFAEDSAKLRYFFPPSCMAHRTSVCDRIGMWHLPMEIRAPVDQDFQRRAAEADLRFLSTGRVTVQKFNAAFRYLSYVGPRSDEQEAMLRKTTEPGRARHLAALVEAARAAGRLPHSPLLDYSAYAPGELARKSAARRGVDRLRAQPVGQGVRLPHRVEDCGHDWDRRPVLGVRRHLRSLWPRLLLPVSADRPVRLSFRAFHFDPQALQQLRLVCNDQPVLALPVATRRSIWGWSARYEVDVRLETDRASVLEFRLTPLQCQKRRSGPLGLAFAVGPIRIAPI